MALDKVKQGVIADDAVGSSQIAPDTVVAADIGANAITASELADNAVDTAAIASNAVTTAKITDANITTAKVANSAITSLKLGDVIDTVPHIIPGVLYPAVAGKLLDGSTSHSGNYGTPQNQSGGDGRSYYYTDIKGSKPIKDPRIGAYFGSQRHKFKSLQLLEQETATHGDDVFSIDGREWLRANGSGWHIENSSGGHFIRVNNSATEFIEITGYFNDLNMVFQTSTDSPDAIDAFVDGTENATTNISAFKTTVNSPLQSRYVDSGNLHNVGLQSTTLGIHTVKLVMQDTGHTAYVRFFGIELIAQDTTSTANKSKIQIPAQNVVSYGKKFEITETNHHYDPFTTMSYGGSGTTLSNLQSLIDTDTSLGMDAWKAGTSNYHRPWNGGRVIKWVDSSGTIKTSVNMMPPNAQNIGTTASNAVSDAHVIAGTNDDTINFNTSAIDHSQAEVAKTFHWREFGNGSANGGTGATYADASMLNTADDIAYVMDDGLTSLSASNVIRSLGGTNNIYDRLLPQADTAYWYITFIGTGFSYHTSNTYFHVVQNLPYGTHIIKCYRDNNDSADITIDGVSLSDVADSNYALVRDFISIHQPKRPPIPEDAVVLADYMLMADFVPQSTAGIEHIPKGVRFQAQSRDYKIDKTGGTFLADTFKSHDPNRRTGQYFWWQGAGTYTQELPFFGDSFVCHFSTESDSDYANPVFTLNGSALSGFTNTGAGSGFTSVTTAGVVTESGNSAKDNVVNFKAGTGTLGSNTLKVSVTSSSTSHYLYNRHFSVATPIHTSSHYQPFETPFLHELVGGDRNMEQTNLVCSPDGKTWDEITRDTSYIGNVVLSAWNNLKNGSFGNANTDNVPWDIHRGDIHNSGISPASNQLHRPFFNKKHFAIAYDRHICLEDGVYTIIYANIMHTNHNTNQKVLVNQEIVEWGHASGSAYSHATLTPTIPLKRGDYVQVAGGYFGNDDELYGKFEIRKVS